jgi:hypothetical protein
LNLTETPEDQDLEGGEIIDIKIKVGAKKSAPRPTVPYQTTVPSSSSSSSSSSPSNEDNSGPKIQLKLRVGNEEAKPVMMAVKRPFSALKTTWCASQGYSEVCVVCVREREVRDV